MKTYSFGFNRSALFVLLLASLMLGVFGLARSISAASPVVTTDKADYRQGETVVITGTDFAPGVLLTIKITFPAHDGRVFSDSVTSESSGGFVYSYILPNNAVEGEYTLDVLDSYGNLVASTTFTDSHFRFGHVAWQRVSGRTVEFTVTQAWRLAACEFVGLSFGDGLSTTVSGPIVATGTDAAGAQYCVRRDTVQHTYSSDGPFTASFSSCCRIGGLVNASDSSFRVETEIDLRNGNGGSPVSSIPPLFQMAQGMNNVALPVADPDGDPITCRMATFGESSIPSVASVASGTLMVSSNCVLTWDASSAALNSRYAVQVMIEENVNGGTNNVALDFIVEIRGDVGNPPECTLNGNSNNTVEVGQPFSITVTGNDPDGDDITINHLGLPASAELIPGPGTTQSSPFGGLFLFTPAPSQVNSVFAVSLTFTDANFLQGTCLFSIRVIPGQGFPVAGPDNFLSIAVFEVMPVGGPNVVTPLLLDFNTRIGRSDPLIEDDPEGEEFERISSALVDEDTVVIFPDGFGGLGRRQVQTEMLSLNLQDRGHLYSVKAGQPALDFFSSGGINRPDLFTPSLGEVESQDVTGAGAPDTDFPADSFFNVYAVVETPFGAMFNKEPLIVESRGITSFPPVAFYPHKSITNEAVPLHSVDDPDGPAVAFLKRSVHGTRAQELVRLPEGDQNFDDTTTSSLLSELGKEPIPTLPVGFPPAGPDSFLSIAVFEVMELQGMTTVLTPLLLDFNTQVGRSDPFDEDDPMPETSEDITSPLTGETVTVVFPDGFGGVGRREVETEITSLNLTPRGAVPFSVKAGQPALDFLTDLGKPELFTPSLGEVESKDLDGTGAPTTDFPADSFFNVYAVVETPMGALFNKDPLIVVSRDIKSFPPVAFYPHQSTTDDPVELFSVDDPDGPAVAILKRSVHGTQAEKLVGIDPNDPNFDEIAEEDLIENLPPPPPEPVGDCSDLLISGFMAAPGNSQYVDLTNVGINAINIDGCSLITYNAFTELSIGDATVDISGQLNSGETFRIGSASVADVDVVIPDGALPEGPAGIAVLDRTAPPDGTTVGDVLSDDITGMVYINSAKVFGISHLGVPEHNAIYECIYGGSGTGPFDAPFQNVGDCIGGQ